MPPRNNIHELPITPEAAFKLPKRIMRPCDYGLWLAIENLKTQLGSVEAYNRLAEAAHNLKAQIDAGNIQAQNSLYATNVRGGV